jgi:hypothetical protein
MVQKISSLDIGYNLGDLSLFPETYDDKSDLYVATNNAETTLKQTLPFMGQKIIVNDASKFPEQGILRVGTLPGKMNGLILLTRFLLQFLQHPGETGGRLLPLVEYNHHRGNGPGERRGNPIPLKAGRDSGSH